MPTIKERVILHCDLNNFFASVECLRDPTLKGKPIAVCGDPKKRHGIVLAKSEEAKKFGVKTGDVIWEAKQKCPDLIILASNHADYSKYGRLVRDIYYTYTDKVESMGIDEAWLDVTESSKLFGSGEQIANKLRKQVRDEIGLTISVGVSFNKTYAKLGSDYKKPDATTVISRENYKQIVYPLPVSDLLFVGRKSRRFFEKLNILTIGDLANFDEDSLSAHIGINAGKLIKMARGEDDSLVADFGNVRVIKSVGNGTTSPHDLTTLRQVEQVIYLLSEEVAFRMRKHAVKGFTVSLSVRDLELSWKGAQLSISDATNSARTIMETAYKVFLKLANIRNGADKDSTIAPVRSLRVAVSNLTKDTACAQLTLFESSNDEKRNDKISAVFDKVRGKYGTNSLMYATLLNSGFSMHFEVVDETF